MPPVSSAHPRHDRDAYPVYPPQLPRDVVRNELHVETGRRKNAVRWAVPNYDSLADQLLDYQRAKPCSMPDQVMGSMRQHLFSGMGVLKPRDAVSLMDALEQAEVVSRMPRKVLDLGKLDAVLDTFRRGGVFRGKLLSPDKKARIRELLVTFDRVARQRAAYVQGSANARKELSELMGARLEQLAPYGHDRSWYRARLLADGSVQRAQDAYVRCAELLHTYPSKLPATF